MEAKTKFYKMRLPMQLWSQRLGSWAICSCLATANVVIYLRFFAMSMNALKLASAVALHIFSFNGILLGFSLRSC